MKYKYLFGPVPSRRLGVSLGIDLVPYKVCSLNCIYCESGATTLLTTERKEYIPVDEIISELQDYLHKNPHPDYVTFSGSGEPTLNSGLGRVAEFIKTNYPQFKIALLTNSTLFNDEQMQKELSFFDLVLPSLDAISDDAFHKINRPPNYLKVSDMIEGLIKLRENFSGEIWLEIFFVPGINDTLAELNLLKSAIEKIKPDRIQLNTLDRPGTISSVMPVSEEKLREIKRFFEPLPVEIIAKAHKRKKIDSFDESISDQILETIKRRPCTDDDLLSITGLHRNELNKYISELLDEKKIVPEKRSRGIFYCLKK